MKFVFNTGFKHIYLCTKPLKYLYVYLLKLILKNTMIYGYARVSTDDQSLEVQKKQLDEFGCIKVFSEKKSGKNTDREELNKALNTCSNGDTLVVTKLDRLGRSLKDLITIIDSLGSHDLSTGQKL